jgi:hypothetical protein
MSVLRGAVAERAAATGAVAHAATAAVGLQAAARAALVPWSRTHRAAEAPQQNFPLELPLTDNQDCAAEACPWVSCCLDCFPAFRRGKKKAAGGGRPPWGWTWGGTVRSSCDALAGVRISLVTASCAGSAPRLLPAGPSGWPQTASCREQVQSLPPSAAPGWASYRPALTASRYRPPSLWRIANLLCGVDSARVTFLLVPRYRHPGTAPAAFIAGTRRA